MNCAIALGETASPHPDPVFYYTNTATDKVIATSYNDFFTNTYSSQCGAVTSCSLYNSGCSTSYSGGNLLINSSTGEITAKQNVNGGYNDVVCVKCENYAGSTVQQDNWSVE
jgi:hypothetical protein